MNNDFAWCAWILVSIALAVATAPIHIGDTPTWLKRVHAVVSLIWIAPVLVRAWMMVVAA